MAGGSGAKTIAEVLERIATSRETLDSFVRTLSPAQLTATPPGAWSVQHHLSHIAAWERMIVAHLTDGSDHAVVGLTPDEFARASLDEINDRLHALHVNDALDTARAEYAAAHEGIVAHVSKLADEDLLRVYWDDDPSERTLADKIAGDTFEHYAEHLQWIREQVEGKRA